MVCGESIDLGNADGWYSSECNDVIALITYRIAESTMEILLLDSLHKNNGIGTALLDRALMTARECGCRRIILITTNDNLPALRFYQKRGFDMVRLYHNALDQARRIKPGLSVLGMDGIPLRREIELELNL